MKYEVIWENGEGNFGTLGRFDTREEAVKRGDNWIDEMLQDPEAEESDLSYDILLA